jgi:hypothetical protein
VGLDVHGPVQQQVAPVLADVAEAVDVAGEEQDQGEAGEVLPLHEQVDPYAADRFGRAWNGVG